MFENLSHLALQQYWWIIISVLAALLVSLMFVQGGQTLVGQLTKNNTQRDMLINSIGRRWDITFTTLVTFGGAFFAAFPLFYSTSFGGAYWVWILILFSFVIQAVSYEFRTKPQNVLGTKTYDTFLVVNGIVGTLLIGAAVGTFFTGSEFSVDRMRITGIDGSIISRWEHSLRGIEAAFNMTNLFLGLAVLFLSRILGLQYFKFSVKDEEIEKEIKKKHVCNTIAFLLFFLTFLVLLLFKDGYAINSSGEIVMEEFKYLNNLLAMPIVLILFLAGVVLVLLGIFKGYFKEERNSLWFTWGGTILVVFSLFLVAGFNNTAYYPSNFDLQSSLTIMNSSSSHYTLTAMSYVSLMIPFIVLYIGYVWKSLVSKKIDAQEIENTDDKY
jgi:cytochrome d ubiquinol oxidase subunit II